MGHSQLGQSQPGPEPSACSALTLLGGLAQYCGNSCSCKMADCMRCNECTGVEARQISMRETTACNCICYMISDAAGSLPGHSQKFDRKGDSRHTSMQALVEDQTCMSSHFSAPALLRPLDCFMGVVLAETELGHLTGHKLEAGQCHAVLEAWRSDPGLLAKLQAQCESSSCQPCMQAGMSETCRDGVACLRRHLLLITCTAPYPKAAACAYGQSQSMGVSDS